MPLLLFLVSCKHSFRLPMSKVFFPCGFFLSMVLVLEGILMLGYQWLVLLKRTPRALEGGPNECQHLLGVGREASRLGIS